MPDHHPLVDAKIYLGQRRRGPHVRLLVFITQREMYAYARSNGFVIGRYIRGMCLDFTMDTGPRDVEIVFSAGFNANALEYIVHECMHAVLRMRSDSQLAKALSNADDEERFLAYPIGRMASRVVTAIDAVKDGIAFCRPVGAALKEMRAIVRRRA